MANKSEKERLFVDASHEDEFHEATESTEGNLYPNVNSPLQEADLEAKNRQDEELKADLAKLEEEITTLRHVLGTKVQQANAIKRKLGITPIQELTTDLKKGVQTIKDSGAYQKTNEKITEINEKITHTQVYQKTSATLKTVGQKTGTALSSVGAFASRKYGDMRNSAAFKSFEEKVGGAVSNVKGGGVQVDASQGQQQAKVSGSQSEHSFEDALKAETEREDGPSPEQKVPL